jgi:ABC-type multidrug transport system fused ATPase/permease subunit
MLFCYLKATGPRLGGVASSLITTVGCLALAFASGWKLALLVLAFIPFIILGATMEMRIYFGNTDEADIVNSEAAGKVRRYCELTACMHVCYL